MKPCQYNTRLRLSLASLVDASPRGGIPDKWDQDPGVGPWGGTQEPGTLEWNHGVRYWRGTMGVGPWGETLG